MATALATPCSGARIALLSRHEKDRVLAPLVATGLGASIAVIDDFDTDSLGTFTRETPREGSQLDAARRKALIAIECSGASIGLGSEGSFGPGPFGLGSWNLEVLLLVDAARGIEVVGRAHGPGLHVHGTARTAQELADIASRAGFPEHGLVVRPDGPDDSRIRKGLRSWSELEEAFATARRMAAAGVVFVESDLRAHRHPTRMSMIGRAGLDLVERLASACPSCAAPGFGRIGIVPGLPCSSCGMPTEEPVADEFGCVRCPRREERPRAGADVADPGRCPSCNP